MMSYKFSEAAILTRSHKSAQKRGAQKKQARQAGRLSRRAHSMVGIDSARTVAESRACGVPRTQLTRAPFWETKPLSQRDLLTIGMFSTRLSAVDSGGSSGSGSLPCGSSRRVNPRRWSRMPQHTYTPKQGHGIGGIAQPSDHDSVHNGVATAVETRKMPLQTDLLTSLMTDSSDQKLPNQTPSNQAHDHSDSDKHIAHATQRSQENQHVDPDATWADLKADAGHLLEWEDVQDWEEVDVNDASIDDDQILDAEALKLELERSLNLYLTDNAAQQKVTQNVIPQDQIHTEHLTDAAKVDQAHANSEFRYAGFVDHIETNTENVDSEHHIAVKPVEAPTETEVRSIVSTTSEVNADHANFESAKVSAKVSTKVTESTESLETIRVIKVEPSAQTSDVQTQHVEHEVNLKDQDSVVGSVGNSVGEAKALKVSTPEVQAPEAEKLEAETPVAALKTTDVAEANALHEDYTEVHFYVGQVDADTVAHTMSSLTHLPIEVPTERTVACRSRVVLGHGEACFLRAKSGLWSWRVHKLPTLNLHADGPPGVGRNIVMEHRFGLVTVLQGCRVAQVSDHPRTWTMTVVSVEEQALRLKEQYTLRWLDDGSVVFEIQSQWQIAVQSLRLVALVLGNLQKKVLKGYIKILNELVAD